MPYSAWGFLVKASKFIVPVLLLLVVSFLFMIPFPAQAASFSVANGDIGGLIAAINAANSNPGPNTISLAANGTYSLTAVDNIVPGLDGGANALPVVTGVVNIEGNGATIERNASASSQFRFFYVNNGTLTLNRLNLSRSDSFDNGGTIYNNGGTLNLNEVVLVDNQGNNGAGILNNNGRTTINNSTFSGNVARGANGGDAVMNYMNGIMTITNSTFTNHNGAIGFNTILDYFGGGLSLTNVTVANNKGIGIYNLGDNATLTNVTIANNSIAGIANSGTSTLHNTLLVNNGPSNCISNTPTNISSNNLAYPNAIDCGPSTDTAAINPLASNKPVNNGGPTQTIALIPLPNPAVDAGASNYCPATDQRGVARVGVCDIGAFELTSTDIPKPTSSNPADLTIAQLRINPDRVVALDSSTLISFTFNVTNSGLGKAENVMLRFPLNPDLALGYTLFEDNRIWVSAIVSNTDQPYVQVSLPQLESKQNVRGVLVFRPAPNVQGGNIVALRYLLRWDDETGSGKTAQSNLVRFRFANPGEGSWDDTGGAVQLFDPPQANATNGQSITITGDFYIPYEQVVIWYTDKNGVSTFLDLKRADRDGKLVFRFTPLSLNENENYVVAGQGQYSQVTGSIDLTITS